MYPNAFFLPRYDDIRAAELERMEREDENFVKAVFSKEGDVKVGKLISGNGCLLVVWWVTI